jgi:hypothetical protein
MKKLTRTKGLDLASALACLYNVLIVTTKAMSDRPALIKLEGQIF